MQTLTDFLGSVGNVLWGGLAITAFVVLLWYRKDLLRILNQLTEFEGEFLGQRVKFRKEMARDLDKLVVAAKQIESESPAVAPTAGEMKEEAELLREGATSPKLALIGLSAEIEREARNLAGSWGHARLMSLPLRQLIQELTKEGIVPSVLDAMSRFLDVRNKVVHGAYATDEDAIRAIDAGLSILNTIKAVPHAKYRVKQVLPVYSDAQCEHVRHDVSGVMLSTEHPELPQGRIQVFPTKKTYEPGQRVAWEWNLERSHGESWYKDPDSGEPKYAWTSSSEFIGRILDDSP